MSTILERIGEGALLALVVGLGWMVLMDLSTAWMAVTWTPLGASWPFLGFWLGRAALLGLAIAGLVRRSRDAAWATVALLLFGVILLSPPLRYFTDHAPVRTALQGFGVVVLSALMWIPGFFVREEAP